MKKFLAGLAVAGALLGCALGLTACDFMDGTQGNGGGSGGSNSENTGNTDNSGNSGNSGSAITPEKPGTGNQGGNGNQSGGGNSGSSASSSCTHKDGLVHVTYLDEATCSKEGRSLDIYVCTNNVDYYGKQRMCGAVFAGAESTQSIGQLDESLTDYNFKNILNDINFNGAAYFEKYCKVVQKTSHSPVKDEAVEATCSAEGKTEGSHCGVCDTVIKAQQTISKGSHEHTDKFVLGLTTYDACKFCGNLSGTEYAFKARLNDDGNSYTVTGIGGNWQTLDFDEIKSYNGKPVTAIGRTAFMENETIKYVNIGGDITSIGVGAFYSCAALEEVVIGNGITKISQEAFSYSPKLKKVTVSDSVTEVELARTFTREYGPFYDCPIESARVPSLVLPYVNNSALETAYVVGGSTRYVHAYNNEVTSLNGCTNLTQITISDAVTYIGDDISFRNCTNLTKIIFNGSISQWNAIQKDTYWKDNTGEFVIQFNDGSKIDKDGNVVE